VRILEGGELTRLREGDGALYLSAEGLAVSAEELDAAFTLAE
jgi:hypothetical protein